MSKSVSEITRENQRSIQNIEHQREQKRGGDNEGPPRGRKRSGNSATLGLWFLTVIFLLLVFFVSSAIFSGTTVTVTPKTQPVSVDTSFTATSTRESSGAELTYQVISISESQSVSATSTATEYKERKATGTMTVINESTSPITLVENTRFQSPDNKIYRTQAAVTVPAKGNETVGVVADKVGESYGVTKKTAFTIPGLSGSEEFATVSGEAADITGGIAKEVPKISTTTPNKSFDTDSLKDTLRTKLQAKVPDNRVSFSSGQFFSTSTSVATEGEKAKLTTELTLNGLTFSNRQLTTQIMSLAGLEAKPSADVRIPNLDTFEFEIKEGDAFDPNASKRVTFSLAGTGTAVWQFNADKLARDLRGIDISGKDNILKKYDAIESADVNTRPFWKRSFPTSAGEIKINTVTPNNS
jgi:hypothetical protein